MFKVFSDLAFFIFQAMGEANRKEKKEIKERREELIVTLSFANARLQMLRR